MITIDDVQFHGISFRQDDKHPIMVTYKWDGEIEMYFCESPLSDKLYDEVHKAIKQRTDNCGVVENIHFWSMIPRERHTWND